MKTIKDLKISCLGSVYSGSKVEEVKLAINSLLNNSIKPDQIVIVIDGKINNKIKKYLISIEQKRLIEIVISKKNIGLGPALNIGLKMCKYELICRFDTDDISFSNRLEESKKAFLENEKLDIFGSAIIEFIESKNKIVKCNIKKVPQKDLSIKSTLNYRNALNHPTVFFKKKSIKDLGNYEDIKFFEDYHLWLKAKKKNYIFSNSQLPLVLMRRKSHMERRKGLSYALNELRFFKNARAQKLISFKSNFIFFLRIISRLIPSKFDFIYKIIPWRENYKYCLNPIYLKEFTDNIFDVKKIS